MEIPLAALAEWCVPTNEEEGGTRAANNEVPLPENTSRRPCFPLLFPAARTTIPPTLGGGISMRIVIGCVSPRRRHGSHIFMPHTARLRRWCGVTCTTCVLSLRDCLWKTRILFFLQQLVNLLPELIVSVLDAFEERRTTETKH